MLVIWLGALFVLGGLLFMAFSLSGEGGSVTQHENLPNYHTILWSLVGPVLGAGPSEPIGVVFVLRLRDRPPVDIDEIDALHTPGAQRIRRTLVVIKPRRPLCDDEVNNVVGLAK